MDHFAYIVSGCWPPRETAVSHERKVRTKCVRNAPSWEKFDDKVSEASAFSGPDEKRVVIQARRDGGAAGFNLACT